MGKGAEWAMRDSAPHSGPTCGLRIGLRLEKKTTMDKTKWPNDSLDNASPVDPFVTPKSQRIGG
jgi:hypothetical protein